MLDDGLLMDSRQDGMGLATGADDTLGFDGGYGAQGMLFSLTDLYRNLKCASMYYYGVATEIHTTLSY